MQHRKKKKKKSKRTTKTKLILEPKYKGSFRKFIPFFFPEKSKTKQNKTETGLLCGLCIGKLLNFSGTGMEVGSSLDSGPPKCSDMFWICTKSRFAESNLDSVHSPPRKV